MARASLRDSILEAGLKVMVRKGYGGAGVRDIVAEAPAPQGSFTNHFRSKEEFAREVLDLYFARLKRLVAEALDDGGLSPRERLRRYLDIITRGLAGDEFSRGCLIGDFSLEAVAQSETLRARLGEIFAEWRSPVRRLHRRRPSHGRDRRAPSRPRNSPSSCSPPGRARSSG